MNTTPLAHPPSLSRKQQAANVILSMQDCLEENKDGGYNREAFDRMQELVASLRYIGGPFGEKLGGSQVWRSSSGIPAVALVPPPIAGIVFARACFNIWAASKC